MIRLKNKTSVFNIKNCVRYEWLIKPLCQLYKNTPAYYGTGRTVTVDMNYLVSSCSDDPERRVLPLSQRETELYEILYEGKITLYYCT